MLHVQEAIPHSSSLMFAQLLAAPLPQPSTSSRSTRVIEQLQDTLETMQREVLIARSQLEVARKAKKQHEHDVKMYSESNTQYRAKIQELMKVLESKQQMLDVTKRSSSGLESQVKKLKDEAMASRKQLEDLRRRELVLEHDRNVAVAMREQTERQQFVLKQSLEALHSRFDREVASLRHDLVIVQHQTALMMNHNQELTKRVDHQVKQRMVEQKELLHNLCRVRTRVESNTQEFVDRVSADLASLWEEARNTSTQTGDVESAVTRCRGEVSGLVARIKAYTAESSALVE